MSAHEQPAPPPDPQARPLRPASRSPGAFRLFEVWGIEVGLHWSWIIIAIVQINYRKDSYSSLTWNVAEYLALFVIVLLHEFGHAFACRSVGGKADRIILWPLGGVAYVQPPPRPGATLWSVAAGPLVNLVLVIPATAAWTLTQGHVSPDVSAFLFSLVVINIVLFVFNCLPVYPLDGGQMLRSLLWFFIGRARSLYVASVIGLIGAAGFLAFAAWRGDIWLIVLAGFGGLRAWAGLKQAKVLGVLLAMPVHAGIRCPSCQEPPPKARYMQCQCKAPRDVFEAIVCETCALPARDALCVHCGERSTIGAWRAPASVTHRPAVPAAEPAA